MGLVERSTAAGILIAFTFLLRRSAFDKLPKGVFVLLWKIAVLRFLVPFSLQVENVFAFCQVNRRMVFALEGTKNSVPGEKTFGFLQFLLDNRHLIWFLGVTLLAVFFMAGYIKAYLLLREAIPIEQTAPIGLDREGNRRRATDRAEIRVLDRIATPTTYGIFRPQIILPAAMDLADRDTLSYVLRHEMAHIRHKDNLWKLLAIAALCIHWFNPLALAMFYFLNRDMEIACDESVISSMDEKGRKKYALALVALAEMRALFPMMCSGFGKSAVSERIREIMNYKKATKIGSICAAFVLMGGTMVFVSAKEAGTDGKIEAVSSPAVSVAGEALGNGNCEETVNVYFEAGISEERIKEIGSELLNLENVEGVGFISAEEAWEIFAKEYLGETALSFKENPLKDSASYTVYLEVKSRETIDAIKKIKGVRKVAAD